MGEGAIDKPAGRIYHGVADDSDGHNARILVMGGGGGPTQRKDAIELYRLTPSEPFWWGYSGSGPGRTAAAILDDVLPDAIPAAVLAAMPDVLSKELVSALMDDFLAHFHDGKQFWLSATTVVRWLNGYLKLAPSFSSSDSVPSAKCSPPSPSSPSDVCTEPGCWL